MRIKRLQLIYPSQALGHTTSIGSLGEDIQFSEHMDCFLINGRVLIPLSNVKEALIEDVQDTIQPKIKPRNTLSKLES